jgi:hypothetical protein
VVLSGIVFERESHYIAQAGLELVIFLPLPHQCWDYTHPTPEQKTLLFTYCFKQKPKNKGNLCSWNRRLKFVKTAIIFQIIYRFNITPMKIPAAFFVQIKH